MNASDYGNQQERGPRSQLLPMTGRDPNERGRAASPLELLFDLTFVVAVGTAASQFAEMLAEGHVASATFAFVLAMFAICLAWLSFSWFGSAFDTDDWLYRTLTMIQMVGVVVFALGLPPMFHSVEEGGHLEMRLMVIGYVVMRLAMVLQWWRAARSSPEYSATAWATIRWTVLAQIAWVIVAFSGLPNTVVVPAFVAIGALELLVPVLAQGSAGRTPWHPHHLAERYALFAIITLGEGVVGTVASSSGLLGGADGMSWTLNTVAVVVAGVGLTFGLWWVYFTTPFGDMLEHRRERGYLFGYGHILLFIGTAGAGAGLHVAGLYLEHHSSLSETAVVLSLAAPVALFLAVFYLLHTLLMSSADKFHLSLIAATAAILVLAVTLGALGMPFAICLMLVMLAPFVTVIGYETAGRRHQAEMLATLQISDDM
ncbi:MAG: low temperature requirement protein A [Rhodococcus sp.]|nr:low temperature requirement protein A [Rhodococcus sp. (in: high G+C Gram-positive bacteria)]